MEKIALEVRGAQRTEIRELAEPFGRGQKGSSAMPHKKNPILSRAPVRHGPPAARLRGGRLREQRPLAGTRHKPLLRREGRTARRHHPRLLHAPHAPSDPARPATCTRTGCSRTSTSAAASCSPGASCSPSSRPACPATTPTPSCRTPRCGRGRARANFGELLQENDEVRERLGGEIGAPLRSRRTRCATSDVVFERVEELQGEVGRCLRNCSTRARPRRSSRRTKTACCCTATRTTPPRSTPRSADRGRTRARPTPP